MKDSLQRTSGDVRPLVDRTKTFRLVADNLQRRRHGELAGVNRNQNMNNQGPMNLMGLTHQPLAVKMNRAFPCSLYTHRFSRSRALSTTPKKGGMGGIPPSLGLFLEGGLGT